MKLPVLPTTPAERIRRAARDTRRGGVLAADGGWSAGGEGEDAARAASGASGEASAGAAPVAVAYPATPLWNALRDVMDPELPVSVVDLGLIVDVRRREGTVEVDLTYTAMACPCAAFIRDDVRERLLREPDVERVEVNEVWEPAWTTARISVAGRASLRRCGVAA